MVAALCLSGRAEARPIEVAARSRVEVDVMQTGGSIEISGAVRDGAARGVPSARVEVRFSPLAGEGEDAGGIVVTDGAGRFLYRGELPPGDWVASVTWAGTEWHDSAEWQRSLDTRPLPLRIELEPSTPLPRSLGAVSQRVRVLADGGPARDVEVHLAAPCLPEALTIATGSDGSAPFAWESGAFAGPECLFRAEVEASTRWAGGEATVAIRLYDDAALSLEVAELDAGLLGASGWRMSGRFSDDAGGIGGAPIAISLSGARGTEIRTAVTSPEGEWEIVVPRADLRGAFTARAEYRPELGGGEEGAVASPSVRVEPVLTAVGVLRVGVVVGVLAIALILGGSLVAERRRARPRGRAGETRAESGVDSAWVEPGALALGESPSALPAGAFVVRLLDQVTLRPVESPATLRCAAVADGESWETDVDGRILVPSRPARDCVAEVAAEGYLRATLPLGPGAPDTVALELAPIRGALAALFRSLVGDVAPRGLEPSWWGEATIPEVTEALRDSIGILAHRGPREDVARRELFRLMETVEAEDGARRSVVAAEALGRLVDEVYFGNRAWNDETLRLAVRLIDAVRAGRATDGT